MKNLDDTTTISREEFLSYQFTHDPIDKDLASLIANNLGNVDSVMLKRLLMVGLSQIDESIKCEIKDYIIGTDV